MSSELIEIEDDDNGTSVSLEMNFHGHAWIVVCSEEGMERYHLPPDNYGIDCAKEIVIGLQNWIEHISTVEVSSDE